MDAHGALDSLLGRLTTVLVEEAQLLGGLRGDVEFIKDEMECMNGLLLHLTEAQHRDHLVRAWMKQVVGLTRDCEGNVELYIHYVGSRPGEGSLLGYLRGVVRFLRTVLARHRIATRIRELKVRARDVGDRRQRYGVTVPPALAAVSADHYAGDVEPSGDDEKDLQRRAVLFEGAEPPADDSEAVRKGIDTLIKWLSKEEPAPATAAARDHGEPQKVRVFSIVGNILAYSVADEVYRHQSMDTLFDCKALIDFEYSHYDKPPDVLGVGLARIREEIAGVRLQTGQEVDEELLASNLRGHLKDKRFLIVFTKVSKNDFSWKPLLDALLHAADGCHPGSAIIITTDDDQVALSSSPYKIINARNLIDFYANKADKLTGDHQYMIVHSLLRYDSSAFARKMFLHLLYVNPTMTDKELIRFENAISKCLRLNKSVAQRIVMFCYNELPSKYRSCLLYLSIFPEGHVIKTASLARRWIAEGIVTATTRSDELAKSAVDEADHYWDELLTRGFISPVEIGAAGNIKSCTIHHEVHKVITKIARDVNIVESNLPTDWAHHLSIHSRIGLQKSHSPGDGSKDFAASLPSLAASLQWKLLKVLDLEGCQGLEKHHLKSICKILLLKYLSLRNTDVTELPKQIKELQCLETLDIRQTKVRMLAKKAIMLPLLKHFLAGHKISGGNDAWESEESFPAVEMPLGIQKMKNIELLSHVQVTDSVRELVGISQLLKLRKLGVALHGKNAKLRGLFSQIEKLHRCLRSLSIRMDQLACPDDDLPSLPQFIQSLNISGGAGRLPHLTQEHHQLTKLTLSETYLEKEGLRILGKLHGLRWLRLQHKSYTESELAFQEDEFQSLSYLLVRGSDITEISFINGTATKLERFVWFFDRMEGLSGIGCLPKLKNVEPNGDCNLDPIEEALELHPNQPTLKHKAHQERQEHGTAAVASSSSAP